MKLLPRFGCDRHYTQNWRCRDNIPHVQGRREKTQDYHRAGRIMAEGQVTGTKLSTVPDT